MSDKYVIEFGDEELLIGEHSFRRILGTNTLMSDDDIKSLTPAESKEEKKTIKDIIDGDRYFYIDSRGDVFTELWSSDNVDAFRAQCGNAFLTEEEAKFEKKRIAIMGVIRTYAEPLDTQFDCERKHFYLTAQLRSKSIGVFSSRSCKNEGFHFATEEDARKVIAIVGEADLLKYYLMVKE